MSTSALKSPVQQHTTSGQQKALAWVRSGPKQTLIGGAWLNAVSGKTFATINPSTEQELVAVAKGDAADVDEAVRAARRAFDTGTWPRMSPFERSRALLKIADVVERHAEELAALESLDNGMPLWRSTGHVALARV